MIDWHAIDTVLLDMDGTLLDLHFDNYFWLTHLPKRYAEHHGICPTKASRDLHRQFKEKQGTLDWYCLDYWSNHLNVDIPQLKLEISHLIQERPHAINFLIALKAIGKKRILITNAHRDSLSLKLSATGIADHLDLIISSHDYQAAKESPLFWQTLRNNVDFDPARTLFVDDSLSVLEAAHIFGIRHLFCIRQPDSKLPPRSGLHFPSIHHFDDIMPQHPQEEAECG